MTTLMNVAMKLEREQFLGAAHYERGPGRRGYANGFKSKNIDTQAGTLRLDIPKTAATPEPFYPVARSNAAAARAGPSCSPPPKCM